MRARRLSCCWPRSPAWRWPRLGLWQLSRAAEKEAQQAAESRNQEPPLAPASLAHTLDEAAAQQHRRITLGALDRRAHSVPRQPGHGRPRRLHRRHAAGAAGRRRRGWCSAAGRRAMRPSAMRVPAVASPEGRGHGRRPRPRRRRGSMSSAPKGWARSGRSTSTPSRAKLACACGRCRCNRPTAPRRMPTGCCATGRRPRSTMHKHYGYAFQWFALGLIRRSVCLVPTRPIPAPNAVRRGRTG